MSGAEIKEARLTLDLTQTELADALGISTRRTISDWENGRRKVPGPVKLAVLRLIDQREEKA